MRRIFLCTLVVLVAGCATPGGDRTGLTTVEHYVPTKSTAPAIAGQDALLYVREVTRAPSAGAGVVLFVHGAGTPAEVSFDVPYKDYSWMAFLAQAGYDVFSVDLTGYGRSTRPFPMNDPCNFLKDQQKDFVPNPLAAPCAPSFAKPITTMESDWNDIDAVVNYLRALRSVDRVALVAWSQGGPRTGGYAARHPAKVSRIIALAPAYLRDGPLNAPNPLAAPNGPMTSQSASDFTANWDRQVGCANQYERSAHDAIWADMIASDPVGATWGPGVRRAPAVPSWGFNKAVVAKIQTPYLAVAGVHDKQVAQERVQQLYEDLGSQEKVFIDLGCSSHNAMWESNHLLLFKASLEWLRDGKVNGVSQGMLKLGY